jgi:hypothetical protein
MSRPESFYLKKALLYYSRNGYVMLRNNTGFARYRGKQNDERFVRFGLINGSSDLIGWRRDNGLITAVEVKALEWEWKAGQQNFLSQVDRAGGEAWLALGEQYLRWRDGVGAVDQLGNVVVAQTEGV